MSFYVLHHQRPLKNQFAVSLWSVWLHSDVGVQVDTKIPDWGHRQHWLSDELMQKIGTIDIFVF